MKLIEMLHNLIDKPIPAADMRTYTHQDEAVANRLHYGLAINAPFADAEMILLAGMDIIVAAIREAGELPEDLYDIPMIAAQDKHNEAAQKLLDTVVEKCPDCGGAAHPNACDEPDMLSKDG